MSLFSQLFSVANIHESFYNQLIFRNSTTFVTPTTALYLITAIGAGSAGSNAADYTNAPYGGGGGAGGLAQSLVLIPAGTTITMTVGIGGFPYSQPSLGLVTTGGATTVSVPSILSLTANGATQSVTHVGGTGGTASGGNIMNVTGGNGNTGGVNGYRGGGGGAVGIYGYTPVEITSAESGSCLGYSGVTFTPLNNNGSNFLDDRYLTPADPNGFIFAGGNGSLGFSGGTPGEPGKFGSGGGGGHIYSQGGASGYSNGPGVGGDGGVIIEWFIY